VVEAAVVAAAPGWAGGLGAAAAGIVAGGALPSERRGGVVGTPEGEVRRRNSRSLGGALFTAPILPNFVTPLCKGLRVLELPRVDQVSDVALQLAEKKNVWISFTVAGCRVLSWSHRTVGLLLPQPGWSSHLLVLWEVLRL
jgi:hypothetical protein